jgi:acetolactate synthase small subunit
MNERSRPWTRPIDQLIGMEHVELHLLIALGVHADLNMEQQEKIMADLSALQAAVDNLGTDSTTDQAAVMAAFTALGTQLADLKAQVDALVAGQVDQATIDALTTTVTAADAAFDQTAAAVAPTVQPVTPTA